MINIYIYIISNWGCLVGAAPNSPRHTHTLLAIKCGERFSATVGYHFHRLLWRGYTVVWWKQMYGGELWLATKHT
jgi:hypothetical protein